MKDYEQVKKRLDRYLRFNFHRTEGLIGGLDGILFRELVTGQIKHGIQGSLVEIGVHYGRSFFLLALGRSGSEKALAVDLFEDDLLHTNRQGIGRFGGFRENCRKYRLDLSEGEILKGSSLEISAQEIVDRVGEVRFFSIDGGHMYKHVANDLRLAEKVLTRDGIICLDDMFSALWPEVAIATFDWLRAAGNRFVPFLATKDKLYLCDSSYASLYLAMIQGEKELSSRVFRSISLLSHETLVLLPSRTSRVFDRVAAALFSVGRLARMNRSGTKGHGPSSPLLEPLGTESGPRRPSACPKPAGLA
jgi:hypothetical protein